jgi:signal transduction histidine kinase
LCLLAAGAAVITGACGLVARDYLMRQADQQLRSFAAQLVSHPFVASPLFGLAAGAPSTAGSSGGISIEVRGSRGQLVMRAGPAARTGPVIPQVLSGIAAHAGQLVTVAAGGGGGGWRVIAEPIHYQVRRIPFSYSADGFSVLITSRARPGQAGTLVAGLDLASIGHAIGRFTVTGLAVSAMVLLVTACLGVAVIRAILRPVTQAHRTLAAAAAGELSHQVPDRHGGTDAGRLAWSLNKMLSQAEHALSTLVASEAAARRSSEEMSRIIADTGRQLHGPLSVIHGLAQTCRRRRLSASELDRMINRVASEATRMDALIDKLQPTRHDQRQPPQH